MWYCFQSIWTGLLISDGATLIKTHGLFHLSSYRDQCLLLPALGYTAEFQLEHVHLKEAEMEEVEH